MIPNPTSKGKTSEAVILAALVKLGKSVLIPWGEERYGARNATTWHLMRTAGWCAAQCKTGHIRDGCVCFKTSITDARRPLGDGGYAGQVDAFAVYCPQIERVFLVPIEAVRTTIGARLRLEPAKNGQTWNVRWARDFELIYSRYEQRHAGKIMATTAPLPRGENNDTQPDEQGQTYGGDIRRPSGDGGYHGQIDAFGVYCPQTRRCM